MRSSGMTTSASKLSCILGLFSLQPQARKPSRTVAACRATIRPRSLDINPAIGRVDLADHLLRP